MEITSLDDVQRNALQRRLEETKGRIDTVIAALEGDLDALDALRRLSDALAPLHEAVGQHLVAPLAFDNMPVRSPVGIVEDVRFVEDAVVLARAAEGIARTVLDDAALQAARTEPDELRDLVETAFVASINLRDFEDPSWPRVRREHLNHGYQIVAGPGYCLYGEVRFGGDLPEDIRAFPKIVD